MCYHTAMNDYLKERELWWPVSKKILASYKDGSHTEKNSYGTLKWYKKSGFYHRKGDKPAVINTDGTLEWYKNGLLHRDGDKPAVIGSDGLLEWWKNGQWHRDGDKPAVIGSDGSLVWYKNSLRHRTTGPALIRPNKKEEFLINGKNITTEVKSWLKTRKYKHTFTPEQQVEFTLTFS
jgi:hypothetical protein